MTSAMTEEQKILAGEASCISLRRLNHGFADTFVITKPDGSRFAFQNSVLSLDDGDEIGAVRMTRSASLFENEEAVSNFAFSVEREVKRLFFVDGQAEYPVGYVIYPEARLPIILAPGSIFGSLSTLGLETRGRENGLEFGPSYYVVK